MSTLHVLFEVEGTQYVVPAGDVLHMESYSGATRVPGTPPWVAGLVQVRGRVIPVIDLRMRFGLPPRERDLDARIVVVQSGERVVGLLADRAREVLRIDGEAFRPPPEPLAHQAAGWVRAVAEPGDRLVMLMELDKVIGEGDIHGQTED